MLLSSASRESAVFPKSCYHQELEKPHISKQEWTFIRVTLPQSNIILHYIKSSDSLFSQCLFLPFLLPWVLHSIKHYLTVNSPRKAFIPQTPENPDTLSQSGNLSHVLVLNSITDWSEQRPRRFAHHHPKNPISLLKGQREVPKNGNFCHPHFSSLFATLHHKEILANPLWQWLDFLWVLI